MAGSGDVGSWWDAHSSAWRLARALFSTATAVVALYVVGLVAFGVALAVTLVDGSADRLADWADDVSLVALLVLLIVAFTVAGLLVALVGWRGIPRTTLRFCRARMPREGEADDVRRAAASFALAYGMRTPNIWIVDDPAPNALAFGRRGAGHICFTTGALELPQDELTTLACYHVAALASRVFAYATSAADLVLLGEWCTRVLWASAVFVILAVIVGLPIEIAIAYVVGIGLLVLVTRPILLVTDRWLVSLLDETDELVDLETIRHTNLPGAFARLLVALVEDDRRAASRWEVVHLWFERDVVDAVGSRPPVYRQLADFGAGDLTVPAFVERSTRRGRTCLVERARVAVRLSGDEHLTRRLLRAQRSVAR